MFKIVHEYFNPKKKKNMGRKPSNFINLVLNMIWNTELAQATNQKRDTHFARWILWQRGVVVLVLSSDQSSQSQWTTASYRVTTIRRWTAENSCSRSKISSPYSTNQWASSVHPNLRFVTPNTEARISVSI